MVAYKGYQLDLLSQLIIQVGRTRGCKWDYWRLQGTLRAVPRVLWVAFVGYLYGKSFDKSLRSTTGASKSRGLLGGAIPGEMGRYRPNPWSIPGPQKYVE